MGNSMTVDEYMERREARLQRDIEPEPDQVAEKNYDIKMEESGNLMFPVKMGKSHIFSVLEDLLSLVNHKEMYGCTNYYKGRIQNAIDRAERLVNEVYEGSIYYEKSQKRKRRKI